MTAVFADTFFYIAILDRSDQAHSVVAAYVAGATNFMLTTRWVLTEVANYFGSTKLRTQAAALISELEHDPDVQIVGPSDLVYARGLEIYAQRPDKAWSLTDCISFAVMHERKLTQALTADHHFSQAGFTPILANN
jgi:uncharacterized protein